MTDILKERRRPHKGLSVAAGPAGYDYTEEFEFGLDFILEGLERYRRTVRPSKRSK